jgi:hypothetical protein
MTRVFSTSFTVTVLFGPSLVVEPPCLVPAVLEVLLEQPVELLARREILIADHRLAIGRGDDPVDHGLILGMHDADCDVDVVGQVRVLVKQHVAGLTAVHDLEVLEVDVFADDLQLAGDDSDAVVEHGEPLALLVVAQCLPDLCVDSGVALEVANVLVEQRLA